MNSTWNNQNPPPHSTTAILYLLQREASRFKYSYQYCLLSGADRKNTVTQCESDANLDHFPRSQAHLPSTHPPSDSGRVSVNPSQFKKCYLHFYCSTTQMPSGRSVRFCTNPEAQNLFFKSLQYWVLL